MAISEPKPTEYKINNLSVVDFFDTKFVGAIKKEIGEADFQHFCLYIFENDEKVKARLTIGHETRDENKEKILTISASKPELLEKLMNAIHEYFGD